LSVCPSLRSSSSSSSSSSLPPSRPRPPFVVRRSWSRCPSLSAVAPAIHPASSGSQGWGGCCVVRRHPHCVLSPVGHPCYPPCKQGLAAMV
jgi:hypothetical protein